MSRDLSLRASISIVAAAAVVATAFVVVTWPSDDADDSRQAVAQDVIVTPRPATPTPAPVLVPDADREFPKVAGDWSLNSVDLKEGLEGIFGGTGVIAYTGTSMSATGTFILVVYSDGRPVATLRGAMSQAKPRTSTTVSWVSSDRWVDDCDGYTFSAT